MDPLIHASVRALVGDTGRTRVIDATTSSVTDNASVPTDPREDDA